MRNLLVSIALTLLLCTPALARTENVLTAKQAQAQIRHLGGRAFIEKHFERDTWVQLMRGIESADSRWLAVAEQLRHYSDAGSGEDLGIAMFYALAKNPLRVLPILIRIHQTSPEKLCNQTYEAELPKQGVSKYLSDIETGLRRAKSPTERANAKGCLIGLQASREFARQQGYM